MPTLSDIRAEIEDYRNKATDKVRHAYLGKLAAYTGRDTVLYFSGFLSTKKYQKLPSQLFSVAPEDIAGFMASLNGLNGTSLDLILHSPGGSLEAADQIVQYLRAKYDHIRAIIPQNAMSAATMLACACDEIVMGKQSALGPIDPQVTVAGPNGAFSVPAQSILDEFEKAKFEIIANKQLATLWVPRLTAYPQGIVEICTNTLANSKQKVKEWLENFMFRADPEKARKAEEISNWLANAGVHKTHGRPLGYDLCQAAGLKVKLMEDDNEFQDLVLSVLHASMLTSELTPMVKLIENHNGNGHYLLVKQP